MCCCSFSTTIEGFGPGLFELKRLACRCFRFRFESEKKNLPLFSIAKIEKKRRSSSACVEMHEERTVAGLGISQHFSMPRKMLGVCRGLLGILALMRAQQANGLEWYVEVCKCNLKTTSGRWEKDSRDKKGKYCNDWGFDFQSKGDKSPDCKDCKSGYYFTLGSNVRLVEPYQEVTGPDKMTTTREQATPPSPYCVTSDLFIPPKVVCGFIETEAPGPGDPFQTCQHCPIHTIANSQYIANKGARCFYSCEDAYDKMMQGETLKPEDKIFTVPKLVNGGGSLIIQDKDIALFPGSGPEGYMLQISHSVVKFENVDDVENWKTANQVKYDEYKKYISDNSADFYQILRLPPPPRQCRPCAAGKSMFIVFCVGWHQDVPNGDAECSTMRGQIETLKTQFVTPLQSWRRDDISWLNIGAFTDFKLLGVCKNCPAGTYFNENALKGWTDAELIKPVQDYLKKDAWTLKQLRCIPCEYGKYTGADGKSACAECPRNQHVVHKLEDVEIRTIADHQKTELKKVNLLKSCGGCPVGTEYHESAAATENDGRCSSSTTSMQEFTVLGLDGRQHHLTLPPHTSCCKPCLVNTLRSTTDQLICGSTSRSIQPTVAPYGQVIPMTCLKGQQKQFCMVKADWAKFETRLSPCNSQGAGIDTDWATCVKCLLTEKPVEVGQNKNNECELCNKDASGEYFRDGKCQTCDSCCTLKLEFNHEQFEWEKMKDYTTVLDQWKTVNNVFQWEERWKYQTVKVECVPLTRRVMEWDAVAQNINLKGADHYKAAASLDQKKDGKLFMEKEVDGFNAMQYDKIEDNKPTCLYRHCKDVCSNLFYHYSNGCGQDRDPWVKKRTADVDEFWKMSALKTEIASSGTKLGDYVIVSQGKCELCTECDRGQHNPDCNKWGVNLEPKGLCQACKTTCESPGQFLWHASGLRGCDAEENLHGGKVRVLTDYECKACPTWIRRDGRMFAVLGCGNKAKFQYFEDREGVGIVDNDFDVKWVQLKMLADTERDLHTDVLWKFRPFVYEIDYCPDGYYFSATKSGCNFKVESYKLEPGQNTEHGLDGYNRIGCCVQCVGCIPGREKKVQNKWKECDGSTLSDTQKDHCVGKCSTGYYDNNKTRDGDIGECVPCTRCKK